VPDDCLIASSYGWRAISFSTASERMHYVYLLRSHANSSRTYIGLTDDLRARLKNHNEGGSRHTARYRPWGIVCYVAFSNREHAAEFERYLKSGSGHSFAKRHLWRIAG
jgi:putative endonuclease